MNDGLTARQRAKAAGLTRYYTGVPCLAYGHLADRYVRNHGCVACENLSKAAARKRKRLPAPSP